jgi:HEAT repeat protein
MKNGFLLIFFLTIFASPIFVQDTEDTEIRKFVEQLRSRDVNIRKRAVKDLIGLGDKIKKIARQVVLLVKDYDIRGEVTSVLKEIGAREIVKLLDDKDLYVRMDALEALLILQARDYAGEIAKSLKDKESYVRGFASTVLGMLKAKEYAREIAKLLRDKDMGVRYYAVGALDALDAKECIGDLFDVLEELTEKDVDGEVTHGIICVLGRLGAKEYVKTIAKFLKHHCPSHRASAVRALGSLNAREYTNDIVKMLKDEYRFVRWWAASVLGSIGTTEILKSLRERLKEETDKEIRHTIENSIKKIESYKK